MDKYTPTPAPSRPAAWITYAPRPETTSSRARLYIRDCHTNPDTIDPGEVHISAEISHGATVTFTLSGDDLARLIKAATRAQTPPAGECDCVRGAHGDECPAW